MIVTLHDTVSLVGATNHLFDEISFEGLDSLGQWIPDHAPPLFMRVLKPYCLVLITFLVAIELRAVLDRCRAVQ